METLAANSATAKVRREWRGGKEYFVAPLSLIVPGVLAGSQGALFYPEEEIKKSVPSWDGTPIVVYHPTDNGHHVSAQHPGILDRSGIGEVRASTYKGKLAAEGWFDAERTRKVDDRVYQSLLNSKPIELSTGLFTDNQPAPNGSAYKGRSYTHVARNYRPDHLAILPDQVGACSLQDGCGVLVNHMTTVPASFSSNANDALHGVRNELACNECNCGCDKCKERDAQIQANEEDDPDEAVIEEEELVENSIDMESIFSEEVTLVDNSSVEDIIANEWAVNSEGDNCGTGAGGFKKGNTCGGGSKGSRRRGLRWVSTEDALKAAPLDDEVGRLALADHLEESGHQVSAEAVRRFKAGTREYAATRMVLDLPGSVWDGEIPHNHVGSPYAYVNFNDPADVEESRREIHRRAIAQGFTLTSSHHHPQWNGTTVDLYYKDIPESDRYWSMQVQGYRKGDNEIIVSVSEYEQSRTNKPFTPKQPRRLVKRPPPPPPEGVSIIDNEEPFNESEVKRDESGRFSISGAGKGLQKLGERAEEIEEERTRSKLTYGNYCGPGGKKFKRGDCSTKGFPAPTDDVDAACQEHDIAYCKCGATWRAGVPGAGGSTDCTRKADSALVDRLGKLKVSGKAKVAAGTIRTYFRARSGLHKLKSKLTGNSSGDNCGTGAGGFKKGNTCGSREGGNGKSDELTVDQVRKILGSSGATGHSSGVRGHVVLPNTELDRTEQRLQQAGFNKVLGHSYGTVMTMYEHPTGAVAYWSGAGAKLGSSTTRVHYLVVPKNLQRGASMALEVRELMPKRKVGQNDPYSAIRLSVGDALILAQEGKHDQAASSLRKSAEALSRVIKDPQLPSEDRGLLKAALGAARVAADYHEDATHRVYNRRPTFVSAEAMQQFGIVANEPHFFSICDRGPQGWCKEREGGWQGTKEQKAQLKEVQGIIKGLKHRKLTSKVAQEVAGHLMGLNVQQLKELKRRLGIKGVGVKSEMVEKMAARALEAAHVNPAKEGYEDGLQSSDQRGRRPASRPDAGAGRKVAREDGRPGSEKADKGGNGQDTPSGAQARKAVPAELDRVNQRLDRYEQFFADRGQHHVTEWLSELREHINEVGPQEALKAIGVDPDAPKGRTDKVQYWGVGTEEDNWRNMGHFIEKYLERNGIKAITEDYSDPKGGPLISSLVKPDRYLAGDFKAEAMHYRDKLTEAKNLPGLEKSEDLAKLVGKEVTHLTDEVINKLDSEYGKGQWIVKCYDDNAAAGYGIFFPQLAAAIQKEAKDTIWESGKHLGQYGFSHLRDSNGKVVGIKHNSGDEYRFNSKKYDQTIFGDVRKWADEVAVAAENEKGARLPEGSFMAQPAFQAVGISDADRAAGKTWHETNEGRVHLVTRPDGSVSVVPHASWLKGGHLPIVFHNEDTRAMERAALETVSKLPLAARKGQVYAPDVMKTKDGYRVVELNAQGDENGSGYLHDNGFTIDAFTSHLTGREPLHVQFIKQLLTKKERV